MLLVMHHGSNAVEQYVQYIYASLPFLRLPVFQTFRSLKTYQTLTQQSQMSLLETFRQMHHHLIRTLMDVKKSAISNSIWRDIGLDKAPSNPFRSWTLRKTVAVAHYWSLSNVELHKDAYDNVSRMNNQEPFAFWTNEYKHNALMHYHRKFESPCSCA